MDRPASAQRSSGRKSTWAVGLVILLGLSYYFALLYGWIPPRGFALETVRAWFPRPVFGIVHWLAILWGVGEVRRLPGKSFSKAMMVLWCAFMALEGGLAEFYAIAGTALLVKLLVWGSAVAQAVSIFLLLSEIRAWLRRKRASSAGLRF